MTIIGWGVPFAMAVVICVLTRGVPRVLGVAGALVALLQSVAASFLLRRLEPVAYGYLSFVLTMVWLALFLTAAGIASRSRTTGPPVRPTEPGTAGPPWGSTS